MARPKDIKTPEEFYKLFETYVEHTKTRKRLVPKATNKGVLYEEHIPPLTIDGFKAFSNQTATDINRYWYNVGEFDAFVSVVTRIKEEIRQDQIEGALVGQYQQNIVARLNNLTEKTDVTTNGEAINEIKISIITADQKQLD